MLRIPVRPRFPLVALALSLGGCVSTADTAGAPAPVDFGVPGPFHPARHTTTLTDAARDRPLTLEIWYPSEEVAGSAASILDLVVQTDDRATYAALLAAAPPDCPSGTTTAVPDRTVAPGAPWPLIAMSHCDACTRFSTVAVAEHLASHGFVVVAPDHAGNTLFDDLAGVGLPLDTDTLALRAGDLRFVIDASLGLVPGLDVPGLEVDAARVGVFGHSFGAVTAGMVIQEAAAGGVAPIAGMLVGAPPENPLLPGVAMENLDIPLLFEILAEDHSIGSFGNTLIEANYAAAPGPAWQVTLADAGHWSPSDLVGLTEGFMPGCGEDTRDPGGEPFTYLAAAEGRALTGAVAAAFFGRYVQGEEAGGDWLADVVDARLDVTSR